MPHDSSIEPPAEGPGDENVDPSSPAKSEELAPGLLPLGPPVFGRWAFWIAAVPFLIYWGGTAFGGYLEKTRKLEPVHSMRMRCRGMAEGIDAELNGLPLDQAAKLRRQFGLSAVKDAMDDENADAEQLTLKCGTLLDANVADLPPGAAKTFTALQSNVEHFLRLEALVEDNELNEIRELHSAFLAQTDPQAAAKLSSEKSWYPFNYSVACLSALAAVLLALRGYLKIPLRVNPVAYLVGCLGIVVWLGLWMLDDLVLGIGAWVSPNSRAAFNPLEELKDNPTWMYTFLAIRLTGLVLVIPVAEEFFTRGFLMRYIEDVEWDKIPMGLATWKSVVGIVVYGAMAHPGEIVAAVAWFGLVTWMYLRTKNVWDCVVAHGLTNLLLGAYVLTTGAWELW